MLFPLGSQVVLVPLSSPRPRPDLLDFESLRKCNAHYNLQNAFNLAEKELGLTKLLDPEGGRGRILTMPAVGGDRRGSSGGR